MSPQNRRAQAPRSTRETPPRSTRTCWVCSTRPFLSHDSVQRSTFPGTTWVSVTRSSSTVAVRVYDGVTEAKLTTRRTYSPATGSARLGPLLLSRGVARGRHRLQLAAPLAVDLEVEVVRGGPFQHHLQAVGSGFDVGRAQRELVVDGLVGRDRLALVGPGARRDLLDGLDLTTLRDRSGGGVRRATRSGRRARSRPTPGGRGPSPPEVGVRKVFSTRSVAPRGATPTMRPCEAFAAACSKAIR